MSVTVGVGYALNSNRDLYSELQPIATKLEYGLLNGIEYSESDIKPGLEIAKRNEEWENILLLQSPKQGKVGLAYGVHEELVQFETSGVRPVFFEFLNEISKLDINFKKLSFFFASEWCSTDRIRYSYGTMGDLITLLSMPGYWGTRYMIPETGHLQDSDETPFIFDLSLK